MNLRDRGKLWIDTQLLLKLKNSHFFSINHNLRYLDENLLVEYQWSSLIAATITNST